MSRTVSNRISIKLAAKVVRDTFKFDGRSTRSEFVSYVIVSWFLLAATSLFSSFSTDETFKQFASIVVNLPLIGLIVRRLHDQGRSALWGIVCLVPLAIVLALRTLTDQDVGGGNFAALGWHATSDSWIASLAFLAAMFATLYLWFASPQIGPNGFGPDPRAPDTELA